MCKSTKMSNKKYRANLSALYHTMTNFSNPETETFKNIVEKRENAGYQHFLSFPTICSTLRKINFNF